MKTLTRSYIIFLVFSTLMFIYFWNTKHYYILGIYNTYYAINYFYFVILIASVGSLIYLNTKIYFVMASRKKKNKFINKK